MRVSDGVGPTWNAIGSQVLKISSIRNPGRFYMKSMSR